MSDEVKILLHALREAGEAILSMRREHLTIELKANNEIVTAADMRANDMLRTALMGRFPNDGWLSEESVDDMSRLEKSRVWIVDPIDGTIEYAHNIPEYAISVALVEHGEAILGAVYNPATGELFHAIKDHGAWLNDVKIRCDKASPRKLFLASRSEDRRGEWDHFKESQQVQIVGSIAYKLGLIAAGKGDATFSLRPKNEWDIAAGVLIVNEAGGFAMNLLGKPFVFNQEMLLVDGIIATAGDMADEVLALIKKAK